MHDTGIRNSELCVLYDHLLPVLVGRTALLATVVVRSTGNLLHLRHLAFLGVSLYDSLSMGGLFKYIHFGCAPIIIGLIKRKG